MAPPGTYRTAALVIAIVTIARIALATHVPLLPDETYYWEWSRHLAAGYFDHPPGIALAIRAGTAIFGDTPLGVRSGAIAAGAVAAAAAAITARNLTDRTTSQHHAATLAALLATCVPMAFIGFIIATPDAPLLAATALTIMCVERALDAPPRSDRSLAWWIAAGISLGVAFVSKYTAVLVPAGILAAFVTRGSLRPRLAEQGPYVAAAIAVLLFAPVVLWNARHDWASFAFQLGHGLGAPRGSALAREADLVGGQLALVSPIVAVLAVVAVARALRRSSGDRHFTLATVALAIGAMFIVSALRKPVEANWPAPALVAALPLLAALPATPRMRRWRVAGIWLAATLSALVAAQVAWHILPLDPRRDPVSRAYGWDDLAAGVARVYRGTGTHGCPHRWIAADRYQDASELAFHLPGHPYVTSLNIGGRRNQYDLWPGLDTVAARGDCAILVVDDSPAGRSVAARAAGSFERARMLRVVRLTRGAQVVGTRAIWLLEHYAR